MSNSFVSYNPYANPYQENPFLQEISYPSFSEKLNNNTNKVQATVKERSSDIMASEYDRLQAYIAQEINNGQKDLLVA